MNRNTRALGCLTIATAVGLRYLVWERAQRALAEIYRVLQSPEPACPEHSRRAKGKPGGVLSITEEFLDPDYPLAPTTVRCVQEAGFELEERHGNWWIYTLNFRKAS